MTRAAGLRAPRQAASISAEASGSALRGPVLLRAALGASLRGGVSATRTHARAPSALRTHHQHQNHNQHLHLNQAHHSPRPQHGDRVAARRTSLHQTQDVHPALAVLASRLATGHRNDGCKLGLVVEGGGMRGIISGAQLMALREAGISPAAFDAVYGASAGAINATYFLTGQRVGLSIYHEELASSTAFINLRNMFTGRPVMDLDFLIDTVMGSGPKELHWDAVLRSDTPLKVVASCLDSLAPVLLEDFTDAADLAECLKASSSVPAFAGPPRVVRGRPLVDAAVFEPVPVATAVRDSCTHVIALCSRPAPSPNRPFLAKRVRQTIEVVAKRTVLNPPYMREAWQVAQSPQLASLDDDLGFAADGCPHEARSRLGAFVFPIHPPHTAGAHPLTLHPATLLAACDVGRAAALSALAPILGGMGTFGSARLYSPDVDLLYGP